jgi:RNA polymerase sigma-70 factor (ECF subfamily)
MITRDNILKYIESAGKGDQTACTAIYNEYYKSVYYVVFKIVQNDMEAEDLTSEILTKILFNVQAYTPTHTFRSWVCTVAKNYTIDYIRKRKLEISEMDKVPILWETPESILISAENVKTIEQRIETLKPKYRKIVYWRCFDNLSYIEILNKFGLSEATARTYLFRARKQLQTIQL